MPESYQINDGSRIYSNESGNENNIPEDAFVLGCFNQSFKLDPVFFDIWLNIMDKCKSTVLWLLNDNEEMSSNIKNYASERIDTRRIIFADRVDYDQHIKRSGIIDLALDTRVYNGHTTSIEMIQCGVPLITCQGNHFASRVSASILTRVGMKELITYTNDEYENKILSLITNQKEYQNLCNKLEFNLINSSILNTEKFSKSFENMLINLFK